MALYYDVFTTKLSPFDLLNYVIFFSLLRYVLSIILNWLPFTWLWRGIMLTVQRESVRGRWWHAIPIDLNPKYSRWSRSWAVYCGPSIGKRSGKLECQNTKKPARLVIENGFSCRVIYFFFCFLQKSTLLFFKFILFGAA